MADRYTNRYDRGRDRWDEDRNEGRYGYRDRDRGDDRGFIDRASDEVMSWFGDDEAARRRRRDEARERREGRNDWSDRNDRSDYYTSSREQTSGRYRPDYENEERKMYGDRSQWTRGDEDDRWRESRDRFYNRGRETGTGSYQRSDYDRQSGYYGAGQESDYERGRRTMSSGQRYENDYDDAGYGQYGRSNRSYEGYGSDPNQNRFSAERSGGMDDETRRRGYGGQSGYGRSYEQRGYSGQQSDYGRGYESQSYRSGQGQQYGSQSGYGREGEDRDYDARARASQSGYNAQGYGISPSEGRGRGEPVGYVAVSRWTVIGPHSGKSPKGYKRSEDRIREDVCERLMDDGEIDASEIDVKINNNEVTLEGSVPDWQTKRRAEEVIQDVSGVTDVMNNLRVKPSSTQSKEDQTRTMGSETKDTASTTDKGSTTGTTGTSSQSQKNQPRQPNAS